MTPKTLIQAIHSHLTAAENCNARNNQEWEEKHTAYAEKLIKDFLPHGSGFDAGTELISFSDSKIVFRADFHHMNDVGYYDGWSLHNVTIIPSFSGIDVKVSGKDKRNIKSYIGDLFAECLSDLVQQNEKGEYIRASNPFIS